MCVTFVIFVALVIFETLVIFVTLVILVTLVLFVTLANLNNLFPNKMRVKCSCIDELRLVEANDFFLPIRLLLSKSIYLQD
jgi:hypothetical protein